MLTLLRPTDVFEGKAARRRNLRVRIESALAFAIAVVACGLTAAAWIERLLPAVRASLGV